MGGRFRRGAWSRGYCAFSNSWETELAKRIGAKRFILSTDEESMAKGKKVWISF